MNKWKSARETFAVWLLFPLSFALSSLAVADSESPTEEVKRPKIAVVLAGGEQKGRRTLVYSKRLKRCTSQSTISPVPAWEPMLAVFMPRG